MIRQIKERDRMCRIAKLSRQLTLLKCNTHLPLDKIVRGEMMLFGYRQVPQITQENRHPFNSMIVNGDAPLNCSIAISSQAALFYIVLARHIAIFIKYSCIEINGSHKQWSARIRAKIIIKPSGITRVRNRVSIRRNPDYETIAPAMNYCESAA